MSRVELEWLTELWIMEPPPQLIHRLYRDSLRVLRKKRPGGRTDCIERQPWLRMVSGEFYRRLAAAGVYVEGA